MKIEEQVVSLELATKLKSLRVKQDSLFYWGLNDAFPCNNEIIFFVEELIDNKLKDGGYSAFTASELLEMLPAEIEDRKIHLYKDNDNWIIEYTDGWGAGEYIEPFEDNNLCNALAKMLIYLIENNLITLNK